MEIHYFTLTAEDVDKLARIDRSETVRYLLEMENGKPVQKPVDLEVPGWTAEERNAIRERFVHELHEGGYAVGAFHGDALVGFGVLTGRLFGPENNYLKLDLMYVSRSHRGQGIGGTLLGFLGDEARNAGAAYLYISSTETLGTVSFYQNNGAEHMHTPDPELFKKEPKDIHMLLKL